MKFVGGREVVGTFKGYDQRLNLVIDNTVEYLRDPLDYSILTDKTRNLGLVVCRTTSIVAFYPTQDYKEIANPFVQQA